MTTDGDVVVVIESLLSKGMIKESIKDGKLVYNVRDIVDGLFIRCMDCNHICYSMEESRPF